MPDETWTVRSLRRRWKPIKERLGREQPDHPTSIRLHRAFSWMARCEQMSDSGDEDLLLIGLWIGFNALYGRWDPQRREPLPDRLCWRQFLDRVLALDTSGHVRGVLVPMRHRVMSVLDDQYLSGYFWEEPSDARARKSRKSMYDARTWFVQNNWGMILDRLLERVYLLRCQLIHGAATYGGKLNRQSLRLCIDVLYRLLESVILVVIDDAGREDWGAMCYPPLHGRVGDVA